MTEATKCAHGQLSCELCQWTDGYAREVLLSGNETSPIDENAILAAVSARMEAEALAESEAIPGLSKLGPILEREAKEGTFLPAPSVVPLDDLRARLAACVAAGVTSYRDGPLEIRFDPDARKAAKRQDIGEITSF